MTESEFINYIEKLGIYYNEDMLNKLNRYYEMLIDYNKIMNLTGITEKKQVYLKHFYDSLTIVKVIDLKKYKTLCDIGTGAGFPGLVLKIFFPKLQITLIDSLNKRINFLNDVIKELNLNDIETIHSRIEDYAHKNKNKFDIVTARAVAPLNILLEYSIPVVKEKSYFIALKGKIDDEKIYLNALKKLNSKILLIDNFKLPFENSDRTIYKIQRNGKLEKKYPRNIQIIKNKPWFEEVDCSMKLANIICNINEDKPIGNLLNAKKETVEKIKMLVN